MSIRLYSRKTWESLQFNSRKFGVFRSLVIQPLHKLPVFNMLHVAVILHFRLCPVAGW